jgi:hypothetical protein
MPAARTFRRIGASVVLLQALAHTLGHVKSHLQPAPEAEGLRATLRGITFVMLGMRRSMADVLDGFSLTFTLLSLLIPALTFLVDSPAADPASVRRLNGVILTALAALFILSLLYMPPPVLFTGVALLFYLIGWLKRD